MICHLWKSQSVCNQKDEMCLFRWLWFTALKQWVEKLSLWNVSPNDKTLVYVCMTGAQWGSYETYKGHNPYLSFINQNDNDVWRVGSLLVSLWIQTSSASFIWTWASLFSCLILWCYLKFSGQLLNISFLVAFGKYAKHRNKK